MNFNSVDDIVKHFKLKTSNIEVIRNKLRKKQASLHPDKNGGKNFKSIKDENLFSEINNAIKFLDTKKEPNNSLIPINQSTELVSIIKELINQKDQKNNSIEFKNSINERINFIKSHFKIPKITFTSIAAVISFIWLFPSTLKDHIILKNYIDITNPSFTILWLITLYLTITLWFIFLYIEYKEKKFLSEISIESFQNDIFRIFLSRHSFEPQEFEFSKDDLTSFILYFKNDYRRNLFSSLFSINSTRSVAQDLAEVIIERILNNGLITKIEKKSLSNVYKINTNELE